MNETTTGAPLTATVGERLKDDPHVQEVREGVEHAAHEPGAATREGLSAARGRARPGRMAARTRGGAAVARPFPWAALALAAVGWALVAGIGRGIGGRARRMRRRALGMIRR